jgi:hypothetical protein
VTTKKTKGAAEPATQAEAEAIVLRTCNEDMTSNGGFKWPESGEVVAPDWDPRPVCGYGLHGLLDGEGDWGLMNWSLGAKALLVRVAVSTLVQIGGKVKFPRGVVVKVGHLAALVCELLCDPNRIVGEVTRIAALAKKGNKVEGTAASGYASKLAASGYASKLAASGYASKLAASGNESVALAAGYRSSAKAGERGVIALAWYDEAAKRPRLAVGYVGEGGIVADTWYRIDTNTGSLVRA